MRNHSVPLQLTVPTSRPIASLLAGCAIVMGTALFGATGTAVHAQSKDRTVSQADWNKILTDAKKEGLVVVYTTTAPAVHERIKADFEKAFGEPPGALLGLAIMTDTDNTRSTARAWYGAIRLD